MNNQLNASEKENTFVQIQILWAGKGNFVGFYILHEDYKVSCLNLGAHMQVLGIERHSGAP